MQKKIKYSEAFIFNEKV